MSYSRRQYVGSIAAMGHTVQFLEIVVDLDGGPSSSSMALLEDTFTMGDAGFWRLSEALTPGPSVRIEHGAGILRAVRRLLRGTERWLLLPQVKQRGNRGWGDWARQATLWISWFRSLLSSPPGRPGKGRQC